jgi:hypothetical protein
MMAALVLVLVAGDESVTQVEVTNPAAAKPHAGQPYKKNPTA